jgi:hypothetical protein
MLIRNSIIVSGDAAATAANIAASSTLWRVGIVGDILMHVCDIIVLFGYLIIFWPVNRKLVILAIMLNLVQTSVLVANKLNLLMPYFLIENNSYLSAFNKAQLDSLSYLLIRAHSYGFGIGLIFFGFAILIIGYLIRVSGFLPRIIGTLMQVGGLCYLINSFALLLAPTFAGKLFPAILLPSLIGELSFALWLTFKGVDLPVWKQKAALASL